MSRSLVDRIDETREKWAGELSECREAISIGINVPLDRLVVELDYLIVEAKQALKAKALSEAAEAEECVLCNTLNAND